MIQVRELTEISNNSQLTNIVLNTLNEKLTDEEKINFRRWLNIVKTEQQLKINQTKNKFF